jgi:hypothetical protein
MDVSGSVALFAGALNGCGRAFVANVLKCGMATIYATARDTASLPDSPRIGGTYAAAATR